MYTGVQAFGCHAGNVTKVWVSPDRELEFFQWCRLLVLVVKTPNTPMVGDGHTEISSIIFHSPFSAYGPGISAYQERRMPNRPYFPRIRWPPATNGRALRIGAIPASEGKRAKMNRKSGSDDAPHAHLELLEEFADIGRHRVEQSQACGGLRVRLNTL